MARLLFDIQGMTCNHCVMRVQKALSEVPGVTKASVTLQPGQAKVDYDENAASAAAMAAAVAKAGYAATAVS